MKTINYVIWKENKDFVVQCLDVDVASQGRSVEEAIENLKEAVALYFQGEGRERLIPEVENVLLGKATIDA